MESIQLPIRDLVKIPISLPPLPEQKAIAGVLSSLDDKIDLLHSQNQTLEALPETLFRQWFVEQVEDDWNVGVLGDVLCLHYGKGLKKTMRSGHGYPVVGSSGIVDYHSDFLVDGPGIVIGRKGTLGKTTYLWDSFFPIDTTYYVESKFESPNLYFEYFLLKSIDFHRMNTDSAVPGLNRNIAYNVQLHIPPIELISLFNQLVLPIFKKIFTNLTQIHTLENLRDMLLPKIMSGKIRVNYD